MDTIAKYCVTAINRLTGEREPITRAMPQHRAEAVLSKLMASRSTKRPYIYPKLTACELTLF